MRYWNYCPNFELLTKKFWTVFSVRRKCASYHHHHLHLKCPLEYVCMTVPTNYEKIPNYKKYHFKKNKIFAFFMFIDFLNQFLTFFGRGGPKRGVQNLSNHHHQLKTISPNHQDFKVQITKSPHFFKINHHHHHFLESPNHHIFLAPITKSPLFFWPQSPITKRPLVPPKISLAKMWKQFNTKYM